MRNILIALVFICTSAAQAQVQIGSTEFFCNQEGEEFFITTPVDQVQTKISFKKALKSLRKEIKKAKDQDAKTLLKNTRQDIKNCRAGFFLKETPSFTAVENDCVGDFDTSANENSLSFNVTGDLAIASGVIDGTIVKKVKNLIANNPNLRTIVMTYMPGSDNDERNIKASRLIHNAKISTCVPENGLIASGAVDMFLAGVTRSVTDSSFVGVHSWANGNGVEGGDLPQGHRLHKLFLNYYRDIDVNTDFYWFTLNAAPADDIHNMTAEERVQWNIETSRD